MEEGCKLLPEASGIKKNLFTFENYNVKHGLTISLLYGKQCLAGMTRTQAGEEGGVKAARGPHLIQQNDVGGLEDGAGDGHTLLLPTAQLQSPLAHLRLVPCGYCPPLSSHTW